MNEVMGATAFVASGYGHPVVGWASDIETYDYALLQDYFSTFYAPNNLVAAVVGDVNAEEVFALCEKYFGKIPASKEAPVPVTREPKQTGEQRVVVEYDANPSVSIGWHCPAAGHQDGPALDVMTSILSSGRTSRFNKSIVEDKKLATRASIWASTSRLPDLIVASGTPIKPHTCEEVEQAIYEEIEKLKTEPVTEWEIEKIRNQLDAEAIRGMNSNMGMAWRLVNAHSMYGDWHYLIKGYEDLKKVTAEDIMRVANTYFTPETRTVVTMVKPASKEEANAGDMHGKMGYREQGK